MDGPTALFLPNTAKRYLAAAGDALARGEQACRLLVIGWVPVVALAWPRGTTQKLVEWADANRYPANARIADDELAGRFLRATSTSFWAATPSLIQHPDETESLARNNPTGPPRTAFRFIDG